MTSTVLRRDAAGRIDLTSEDPQGPRQVRDSLVQEGALRARAA